MPIVNARRLFLLAKTDSLARCDRDARVTAGRKICLSTNTARGESDQGDARPIDRGRPWQKEVKVGQGRR
jgi:hypothetical protein